MIFEAELGIRPSEWLKYAPLDDFLAENRIPILPVEEAAVSISGLHISLLRLIVASFVSIGAGALHRFVPTATGRHIYSLVTGFALLYYPFGNQVLLSLISCLLVYGAMLASPRLAGKLSWTLSFGFLLLCMERTGDLWDTGAVDIVGSLMVIVLKQVAIAHNISDAKSKRVDTFTAERKALLLDEPPSLLQYLSFMYAYGNLLAGPFNEYKEYAAFTERTGVWKEAFVDGMFGHAMAGCGKAVLIGLASLGLNRVLEANFNAGMLVAPQVWDISLGQRFAISFITGFAKRSQYYFIWGISEAAMNASGFGFNGFSDPEKKVPKYDRYVNAAVLSVETCTSIALIPRFWNINTGYFLRRYVYERWGGGVPALAATQMISGLWHGLREGHLFYFLFTIPMFHSSKIMYKQEGRLPRTLTASPAWTVAKYIMAHTPNNVFCQAFLLQRWELFWSAWKAMYFVPHIFVLFWCVVGVVVPTPKHYKSKDTSKEKSKENFANVREEVKK